MTPTIGKLVLKGLQPNGDPLYGPAERQGEARHAGGDAHGLRPTLKAARPDDKAAGPESDLHDDIETYCREHGWAYVHSRMDKKSTTAKGVADWVIFADKGRIFTIEAKSKTGKHTVEQIGFGMQLNKLGHQYWTVRSMQEFKAIVDDPTNDGRIKSCNS